MKYCEKIGLLFVLIITVYGIWYIWDYWNLFREGRIGNGLFGSSRGSIPLFVVPVIGIWMDWSGFWNIVNAGQDWDRSMGYMKIMGGTALIIITNLFLYVLAR